MGAAGETQLRKGTRARPEPLGWTRPWPIRSRNAGHKPLRTALTTGAGPSDERDAPVDDVRNTWTRRKMKPSDKEKINLDAQALSKVSEKPDEQRDRVGLSGGATPDRNRQRRRWCGPRLRCRSRIVTRHRVAAVAIRGASSAGCAGDAPRPAPVTPAPVRTRSNPMQLGNSK